VPDHDDHVDTRSFVAGMADTVQALDDLTNAIAHAPTRQGMITRSNDVCDFLSV
jgi:hypothetical protein